MEKDQRFLGRKRCSKCYEKVWVMEKLHKEHGRFYAAGFCSECHNHLGLRKISLEEGKKNWVN